MDRIPPSEYQKRQKKLLQLLDKHNCDAILIYNAEKEDPSFLPWILGADIFDTTYLLLTKEKTLIFIPQWRLEEADQYSSNFSVEIVGTPEKTTMTSTIKPYLKNKKNIGFAGNLPYKEVHLLGDIELINIEESLRNIYQFKTSSEIKMLSKAREITLSLLDSIKWSGWIGLTEKDLARWLVGKLDSRHLSLSHLCITSGSRTKKTSAGFPSNYRFQANDLVCIDFGLYYQTYVSDITRCYFLGESKEKYESQYVSLQRVVQETASQIKAGMQSQEIFFLIKEKFAQVDMSNSFVPEDLGHGIGTGLHEHPEIGFDKKVLEKGTVFTLEPEARLFDQTLLRYEDMFFINESGSCQVLS
jgi:Xaa-Pro aminopeptidase